MVTLIRRFGLNVEGVGTLCLCTDKLFSGRFISIIRQAMRLLLGGLQALAIPLAVLLAGCPTPGEQSNLGETSSQYGRSNYVEDVHDHHHEVGPNGGHLVDLGDGHAYKAEWLHDDEANKVTVYLLDNSDAKFPVDADSVTIHVDVDGDENEFSLPGVNRSEGKTAEFETEDAELIVMLKLGEGVEATLTAQIDGQSLSGKFDHHDHHHH